MQTQRFREPTDTEIRAAHEALYLTRLMALMGEALNESEETVKRRIAMAVMKGDTDELGAMLLPLLSGYCQVDDETARDQAKQWVEFGEVEL